MHADLYSWLQKTPQKSKPRFFQVFIELRTYSLTTEKFYVGVGLRDMVIKQFNFTYFVLSVWKHSGLRLTEVFCRDQHLTNVFYFICPVTHEI